MTLSKVVKRILKLVVKWLFWLYGQSPDSMKRVIVQAHACVVRRKQGAVNRIKQNITKQMGGQLHLHPFVFWNHFNATYQLTWSGRMATQAYRIVEQVG